jgi:hypothetical protein
MWNMKLYKQYKARILFKHRRVFLIDSSRVVSSASFNSTITTSDVFACVGIAVVLYRSFAQVTQVWMRKSSICTKICCFCRDVENGTGY